MAYRSIYSSGGSSGSGSIYSAGAKKKPKKKGGGGILGAVGDAFDVVDDGLGIGNLAKMGWNFLPGIYNLGKGLVTDPKKTAGQAKAAIGGSLLSTADTVTLGLADKHLESAGRELGAGVEGQDIAPFWSRRGGILPALTEDVLNIASVAQPALAGTKAAQLGAIGKAAAAAEAGDLAAQTSNLARAAQLGATAKKVEVFAHPFRTAWRSAVRKPAMAAVDLKMAAAGASRTAAEMADVSAEVATPPPVPDKHVRLYHARRSGEGGVTQVIDAEAGAEGKVFFAETPEGARRAARAADDDPVDYIDVPEEEAQGSYANAVFDMDDLSGKPTERHYTFDRAYVEGRMNPLDAPPAGGVPDDVVAAAKATADESQTARDGKVAATISQDPETGAAQAADNVVEVDSEITQADKFFQLGKMGDRRNAVSKFLFGQKTPGEVDLPIRTRLMAGAGERLIGADVRHAINLQARYATAARSIALRSEPVSAAVEIAKTYLVENLGMERHLASRIIGDEIASRMNGVRQFADAHGVNDELAVELGWRNEALPKELFDDPEKLATFNDAVDSATDLWRQERRRVLDELLDGRLGDKGLENLNDESPVLTKSEQKSLRQAEKDLERAMNLTGARARETMRAERQVAGLTDRLGKLAEQLTRTQEFRAGAIAAFDTARSGLPKVWKNPRTWNARLGQLYALLTDPNAEFRGFTYDPHLDELVEGVTPKGRYAVGLLPGAQGIPLAQLTPESIDEIARYYQALYDGNDDIMLGAWEQDGQVFIEPSQIVKTRSEAVTLGQARAQYSVWDFGDYAEIDTNFGRPDIHAQFAGSRTSSNGKVVSNHRFRDRYAAQLYDAARNTRHLDPAGVDSALALNDSWAVAWSQATGMHPDHYYAQLSARFRQRPPRTPIGRLMQTIMPHRKPTSDLFRMAEEAGVDIETARKWYFRSHDAIENEFRGKTVTLLNGHVMDQADLVYELLAVSSVSARPLDNLASALTGVANMLEFQRDFGGKIGEVRRLVKEFEDMGSERTAAASGRGPAVRSQAELFKRLAAGTHQMYTGPQYQAFEILSGHTIGAYDGWDGWTTGYLRSQPEQFGGKFKPLSEAKITDDDIAYFMDTFGVDAAKARELAVREYHGSTALAKILSFHDNLSRPGESMAVTLDSWMSRLFGDANWINNGTYRHYADTMRTIADELSEIRGEHIMPHEVQAVFWAYAKEEISRQNVGMLHAYAAEALDMIESGTWTRDTDPLLQWFENEAAPLREAESLRQPNRDLIARRKALKATAKRKKITDKKEVKAFVEADPEVQRLKAEVARIKAEGGSRRITEQKVKTIRTEGSVGIEDARALAPEDETRLHVPTEKKRDAVAETLGASERYETTFQEDIVDALRAGDQQEASRILSAYVNSKARGIRDESWGDFVDFLNGETGTSERLPAAIERLRVLDEGSAFDELAARFRDEVVGATVLGRNPGDGLVVELYRGADFTTLVHEHAHVLRRMLPEEDLKALGNSYGIKYSKGAWTWTREAEERFANDVTGYLASGKAPVPHLRVVFEKLRNELLQRWYFVMDAFRANRLGYSMPEGTKRLMNRYLNPDVSEISTTPGFDLPPEKNLGARSLANEARTTPLIPGATPAVMYRSGVDSGKAIERVARAAEREAKIRKEIEVIERKKAEIKTAIIEGTLPVAVQQRALRARAGKTVERVMKSSDTPSLSRVPAAWQPLYHAAETLVEYSKNNPEMAAQLSDLPQTFSQVLERAHELGINPEHVRSFTPAEVHRLVYQMMKLGKPGQKLGQEIAAGTRYVRRYSGVRATSIEALAAATLEVTWEARTNGVIDMIESQVARQLAPGEALPNGWVFWSPRKRSMLANVDPQTGDLTAPNPEGGLIIPKAADDVLRRYTSDHDHTVFKWIRKATNPWRTAVLVLAPRWYVNNILGNIMLATAEGVRLRDWVKAWHAAKRDYLGRRFSEVPQVTRSSLFSGIGDEAPSLIPPQRGRAGIVQAQREGGLVGTGRKIEATLGRANEVVDEFARAAVYFRTLRKGGSPEHALNRAMEAMVDYHSLSPFEQQVVKSVVPFYAWQKGMLKMGLRLPVDHPMAAATAFWLNRFNQEVQKDEFGVVLPTAYQGVVQTPFGAINTRSANPLADSDALVTPQGIMRSMNPFLRIGAQAGLNAPEFGQEKLGVGPTGQLEEQVDLSKALSDVATGLPQAQVAGVGRFPSYGPAQDVGRFAGIPSVAPEQLDKIIERTAEARSYEDLEGAYIWKRPTVPKGTKKASAKGKKTPKPGTPRSRAVNGRRRGQSIYFKRSSKGSIKSIYGSK